MIRIGLLGLSRPPRAKMPPGRERALLAEAALHSARLLFIAAGDCDPEAGTVTAESWTGAGFARGTEPPPDVVVVVDRPLRPGTEPVLAWLGRVAPVVASFAPDKLDLAALLGASALAPHVIPATELPAEGTADALGAWLGREGPTVVKAADGSRGGGLHFILRDGSGGWVVRHGEAALATDLDGAVAHVCRRIAGRQGYRRYLAQRFVPARAADGRALDIRVHIQRDGTGGWDVTRAYVRLGEQGMPMSNVSRGGYQCELAPYLARRAGPRAAALEAELHAIALGVAARIEALRGAPIHELGVDIALDEADRPWIIEANAHPETSLHEHARAMRLIAHALHRARSWREGAR